MAVFKYRESTSAPWQELTVIGSIGTGGSGGGTFAQATITKSASNVFDLSNYISKDNKQFILFFTYGNTIRAVYAPFLNEKASLGVSAANSGSYGIEALYGAGAQSVFYYYSEVYYNAETGILTLPISNSSYTPGTSATLLYIE